MVGRGHRVDHGVDGREVGVARVQRRRAHRDEEQTRMLERVGERRREVHAVLVLGQELLEPGLPDGHHAALEAIDLGLVDVDAPDVGAQLREADRGDEAHVAGADDADRFALCHASAEGY